MEASQASSNIIKDAPKVEIDSRTPSWLIKPFSAFAMGEEADNPRGCEALDIGTLPPHSQSSLSACTFSETWTPWALVTFLIDLCKCLPKAPYGRKGLTHSLRRQSTTAGKPLQ